MPVDVYEYVNMTIESIAYLILGGLLLKRDDLVFGYDDELHNVFYTIGIITLVTGSVTFLTVICLFTAVAMKIRSLILPWLIIRGILMVVEVYNCTAIIQSSELLPYMVPHIIWMCFSIYLFSVVYAYYKSPIQMACIQGPVLVSPPTTNIQFVNLLSEQPKPPDVQSSLPPQYVPNSTRQQMYPPPPYAAQQQPYAIPTDQITTYPATTNVYAEDSVKIARF